MQSLHHFARLFPCSVTLGVGGEMCVPSTIPVEAWRKAWGRGAVTTRQANCRRAHAQRQGMPAAGNGISEAQHDIHICGQRPSGIRSATAFIAAYTPAKYSHTVAGCSAQRVATNI